MWIFCESSCFPPQLVIKYLTGSQVQGSSRPSRWHLLMRGHGLQAQTPFTVRFPLCHVSSRMLGEDYWSSNKTPRKTRRVKDDWFCAAVCLRTSATLNSSYATKKMSFRHHVDGSLLNMRDCSVCLCTHACTHAHTPQALNTSSFRPGSWKHLCGKKEHFLINFNGGKVHAADSKTSFHKASLACPQSTSCNSW